MYVGGRFSVSNIISLSYIGVSVINIHYVLVVISE